LTARFTSSSISTSQDKVSLSTTRIIKLISGDRA